MTQKSDISACSQESEDLNSESETKENALDSAKLTNTQINSLQASGQGLRTMGMQIRRLTPIECERLQGFPDNWTEGFSDTQRYKMMGNAVTVNVIKTIAERIWKQKR